MTTRKGTEPGLSSDSFFHPGGAMRPLFICGEQMHIWGLLLAAGRGTRLAEAGLPDAKQFLLHEGTPLYWASVRTLARVARIKGLVFVFPPERVEAERERIAALDKGAVLGLPWVVTAGGTERQHSVNNGLAALPAQCNAVLVHDTARPFATAELANRVIDALAEGAKGVVPGLPVTDTIKETQGDAVVCTLDRSRLVAVQTPQGFDLATLRIAHARAEREAWAVTDDAALLERCGEAVRIVMGEAGNCKITRPEDIAMLHHDCSSSALLPCTGWGYDVHRYGPGRPMKLGGVSISGAPEVVAHSDGDVLLHALSDALLGCIGGGDIGQHFPDSDAAFDNANSAMLLDEVLRMTAEANLVITHVDLTIIAQVPKLAPWREQIRTNIAQLLGLDLHAVNVKATTEEGLGFTGEKKGIKAVAAVTGLRPTPTVATAK